MASTSKGVGKTGPLAVKLKAHVGRLYGRAPLHRAALPRLPEALKARPLGGRNRFSALSWGTRLFKIGGPFEVKGIEWKKDMVLFEKWREGRTGFPFVDAGMRELAVARIETSELREACIHVVFLPCE